MILKALADYYERLANDPSVDVAPYGFEYKAIPFLTREYRILGHSELDSPQQSLNFFPLPHGHGWFLPILENGAVG
jgi:hypothetical protein